MYVLVLRMYVSRFAQAIPINTVTYITVNMVKKAVTIKLTENDREVLSKLGGNTKGVETLIYNYQQIKPLNGESDPETMFFDCLYLPSEQNLRATYTAFLNAYIAQGNLAGTIGAYIGKISGETGYDEPTTRKHFRKLTGSGFIKLLLNMMFRPTLRLRESVTKDQFKGILETYSLFIQGEANFTDFWSDE